MLDPKPLEASLDLSDLKSSINARKNLGFVDSRGNFNTKPNVNLIVDQNANTQSVTMTTGAQSSPCSIGSKTHVSSGGGVVPSGGIMPNRLLYVASGSITYNSVVYTAGQYFTGVFGVLTYTGTGVVKNPATMSADSAYVDGQAYVATISGGYDHLNNQIAGTICGGGHNELRSKGGTSNHSTISGGSYNIITDGLYPFIGGGSQNESSQDFSIIVGGQGNTNLVTVPNMSHAVILGGYGNYISDHSYGLILHGGNHKLTNPSSIGPSSIRHNTIVGGLSNSITGGSSNTNFNTIVNGTNQAISGNVQYSGVLMGQSNSVSGSSTYVLIGGSSISVSDLSHGQAFGSTLTMGAGTHNYLYGQSGTLTGGQFNWSRGLSISATGTPTYCDLSGTAHTLTGTNTGVTFRGSTHSSAGMVYGGAWGFNHNFSASSNHDYAWGEGHSFSGGAIHQYAFGIDHTITTSDYGLAAGRSCTISDDATAGAATQAQYAFSQGYQARARSFGQRAFSNGKLNTTIENQTGLYKASRRYTHATGALSSDLRLDGVGQYIRVPDNSVMTFRCIVQGVLSDGSKWGSWSVDFMVRDSAGTLTVQGSPAASVIYNGHSSTWSIAPAIRSSPRGVTINVTALNGETINWSATLIADELNTAW